MLGFRGSVHLAVILFSAIFAVAQDSPSVSADQIWNDLAAGNQRFVTGKTAPEDFVAQGRR